MIVLSENYWQNLEKHSIQSALTVVIAPETFRRYVDGSRNNAKGFLKVLNSQGSWIKYTNEYESDNKELSILDVTIWDNYYYSYDFTVYRKPAMTNVRIKPHSNDSPHITMGVLKGFS